MPPDRCYWLVGFWGNKLSPTVTNTGKRLTAIPEHDLMLELIALRIGILYTGQHSFTVILEPRCPCCLVMSMACKKAKGPSTMAVFSNSLQVELFVLSLFLELC